ncbi:hypothetical protein ACOMHN_054105 [Nucella lapillus]
MPPPDRWENYQPLGTPIPDTRFIAFKVPLKEALCKNLHENESFSPQQLIDKIQESGKRLGLIVDLTFTRKYYSADYFEKRNIQYEKIFTAGHEVPSDDIVQRFHEVVDDFSNKNTDEGVIIGVHCTHGVNRTGYMVCRYMIDRLRIDPDKAIELFGDARGHPIERENYLKDLKMRSLSGNSTTEPSGWSRERGGGQEDNGQSDFGQHNHDRDDTSWKRTQPPRDQRGCSRGQRHDRLRVSGRPPCRLSERGQNRQAYSSSLEQFDSRGQNGWWGVGAANSGWGSSAQGEGHPGQGFLAHGGRGAPRWRPSHDQQQHSWRRSDQSHSHAGGQSYRDRTEDPPRDGRDRRESWETSRADRDRNWRHRHTDDDDGRSGNFGGYQGNNCSRAQSRHSGNLRDRGGEMGGQGNGGWAGGGNEGWRGDWNNGSVGWNGGGSQGRNKWSGGRGRWNNGGGGGNNGRGGWNEGSSRGRGGWNRGRGGPHVGRGGQNGGDQTGLIPPSTWHS